MWRRLGFRGRFLRICVASLVVHHGSAFCVPGNSCWPSPAEWSTLNETVGGRLSSPTAQPGLYANASYMVYPNWQHVNGSTEASLALPALAVTARNSDDVVETVRFANKYDIRLVVKSTGHSHTGDSTAADALLLMLASMQDVQFSSSFDDGCGSPEPHPAAVTVQPGVTFGKIYPMAAAQSYEIVGGGGPTVSAAGGYLAGGGHSPLGRALGTVLLVLPVSRLPFSLPACLRAYLSASLSVCLTPSQYQRR